MAHRLALALVLFVAAAACSSVDDSARGAYGMRDRTSPNTPSARVPDLDPARNIAEQDCAKPVALDQGNLKCK